MKNIVGRKVSINTAANSVSIDVRTIDDNQTKSLIQHLHDDTSTTIVSTNGPMNIHTVTGGVQRMNNTDVHDQDNTNNDIDTGVIVDTRS